MSADTLPKEPTNYIRFTDPDVGVRHLSHTPANRDIVRRIVGGKYSVVTGYLLTLGDGEKFYSDRKAMLEDLLLQPSDPVPEETDFSEYEDGEEGEDGGDENDDEDDGGDGEFAEELGDDE